MRKLLLFMCALCAILPLSSCIRDKEAAYSFEFEVQAKLKDEADWEELKAYFDENYTNESMVHNMFTTYSDACMKSLDLFDQGRNRVDGKFILDHITDEEDVVILIGVLSGKDLREPVNSTYWDYNLKKTLYPD